MGLIAFAIAGAALFHAHKQEEAGNREGAWKSLLIGTVFLFISHAIFA